MTMVWWWITAAVAALAYMAVKLMEVLWWRPRRVEEHFARQGIRGPPYRFFIGCVREMVALMVAASAKPMPPPYRSHNVLPRVLAFYHHWKKIYGTSSTSPKAPTITLHAIHPWPSVSFFSALLPLCFFFNLKKRRESKIKR
jgi:PHYB activation tagged suppressor 1